jgi:hypothetical protein
MTDMLLSLLTLAAPLLAAEVPASETSETDGPEATAAPGPTPKTRKFLMEVNFRGRYMFVPNSILDIWYERHEGGEDGAPERPNVRAYTLGLEFVVKDKQANGIFYLEYISSVMKEGYWDDRDNPPIFTDGSYVVPEQLGLVAFGANYAYDLKATNWLSFLFGAGIGLGIKTGQLVEWEPGEPENLSNADNTDADCGRTSPAYDRRNDCGDDGAVRVPPVVPIVDVNIGVRFNISDRANIRIEGGLHDLPYLGGAAGITF